MLALSEEMDSEGRGVVKAFVDGIVEDKASVVSIESSNC